MLNKLVYHILWLLNSYLPGIGDVKGFSGLLQHWDILQSLALDLWDNGLSFIVTFSPKDVYILFLSFIYIKL